MVNKKILTALAFIFLISLATAEVSHEADQIFFTDNDNLQQKFDNGDFGKWDDGAAAGDIYYDDGNVGIGTDSPDAPLHVTGNMKVVDHYFDANDDHWLRIRDADGGTYKDLAVGDFHTAGSITLGGVSRSTWPATGITTCSTCDSRFVNAAGDTMSGGLTTSSHLKATGGSGKELDMWHGTSHAVIGTTGETKISFETNDIARAEIQEDGDIVVLTGDNQGINFVNDNDLQWDGGAHIKGYDSQDYLYIDSGITYIEGSVGIGEMGPHSLLEVRGNGGVLSLTGSNHVYIQFYPAGYSAGRKAYIGFPNTGSTTLDISNEYSGAINLDSDLIQIGGDNVIIRNSQTQKLHLDVEVATIGYSGHACPGGWSCKLDTWDMLTQSIKVFGGCTGCSVLAEMAPVEGEFSDGDTICINPETGKNEACKKDKATNFIGIATIYAEQILRSSCSDPKGEGQSTILGGKGTEDILNNPGCKGWYPIGLDGLAEFTNVVCYRPDGTHLQYGDSLVTSTTPGHLRPLTPNEQGGDAVVGKAQTICSKGKTTDKIQVWIK